MVLRVLRWPLRHRAVVTGTLVAVLLFNLLVVVRVSHADPLKSELPVAGRCQGGGPGCDEQPLIPPPVGGLPHFEMPAAPVFGALVVVEPHAAPALHAAPPPRIDRPPTANTAA